MVFKLKNTDKRYKTDELKMKTILVSIKMIKKNLVFKETLRRVNTSLTCY